MIKKILSILAIVFGSFMLIGAVMPMIMGAVLRAQVASSVGIIGGADGPTSIMIAGVCGTGNIWIEIVVGILMIVVGIWGFRKL